MYMNVHDLCFFPIGSLHALGLLAISGLSENLINFYSVFSCFFCLMWPLDFVGAVVASWSFRLRGWCRSLASVTADKRHSRQVQPDFPKEARKLMSGVKALMSTCDIVHSKRSYVYEPRPWKRCWLQHSTWDCSVKAKNTKGSATDESYGVEVVQMPIPHEATVSTRVWFGKVSHFGTMSRSNCCVFALDRRERVGQSPSTSVVSGLVNPTAKKSEALRPKGSFSLEFYLRGRTKQGLQMNG